MELPKQWTIQFSWGYKINIIQGTDYGIWGFFLDSPDN